MPENLSFECMIGFHEEWVNVLSLCESDSEQENGAGVSCRGPRPYTCQAENIVISPRDITVAAGGEEIFDVLNRSESEELPVFREGALRGSCHLTQDPTVYGSVFKSPLMETMLASFVDGAPTTPCKSWDERPTILIARLDYADVLHAFTEMFHTYVGLRAMGVLSASSSPVEMRTEIRVILLDGHAKVTFFQTHVLTFSGVCR